MALAGAAVDEVATVARTFKCTELETMCENVASGNEWLNASFETYQSDITGKRIADLFLFKHREADMVFRVGDATSYLI